MQDTTKPTLTIIRGLPGSGRENLAWILQRGIKSTLFEWSTYRNLAIPDPKKHGNDKELLQQATQKWVKDVLKHLSTKDENIIVSACFPRLTSVLRFAIQAHKKNFNIRIVTCTDNFTSDAKGAYVKELLDQFENFSTGQVMDAIADLEDVLLFD
jgi:hypothetical protein